MNKKNNKGFKILLVVAFLYFAYILCSQQFQIYKYKEEIKANNKKIAQEEQQTQRLMRIKQKHRSDEYIEKIAREKLGYVKPGEKIYIDIGNTEN